MVYSSPCVQGDVGDRSGTGLAGEWQAEHQYPALSQAHGDRVNQDKADQAKHEQQQVDAALSGSKPTNAAEVAAWLDSTAEPPAPPIDITFPTHLMEAPHEATITIEPLDNYTSSGGGLY